MLVKHFYAPFHPEDREDLKKEAFEVFARNEPFRDFVNRNVHKSGKTVWLMTSGVPIFDEKGNLLGYRGADLDITEYRRIEAEIMQGQKIESMGILAGGIAHDFLNALSGILGPVSAARMELVPEDPVFEMLALAEEATLRAKELTGRLLAFSKGGMPVRKAASISEVIFDSTRVALSDSKIRWNIKLPDDLHPVEIDRGQMTQVFNNLMINASQAMPEGGNVRVFAENVVIEGDSIPPLRSGEYVKITVEDDGPGISKESIPKVFDLFFTTKEEGSGLGLTASYWIVRNHNGHITVESEPGVGAKFLVYLPASHDVQAG
jgi:signal transduction histidine kinase